MSSLQKAEKLPWSYMEPTKSNVIEWRQKVALCTLVILLVASFSRMNPFAERIPYSNVSETGAGDFYKQSLYITLFFACVVSSRKSSWMNISIAICLLYIWFGFTLLWSADIEIAGRRYLFSLICAITVFLCTYNLPFERVFRAFHITTLALLLVGLLAAPILHDRTFHISGDSESGVVGAFRGVFYHKNILGMAAALNIFLSIWYLNQRERSLIVGITSLVVGIASLIMSMSKTPLGFILLCLPIMLLWARFSITRIIVPTLIAASILLSLPFYEYLVDTLSDPQSFTGRVEIWKRTLDIFLSSPFFGVGYLSIFQMGDNTLFSAGTNNVFYATLSHAHNAYLEIAASTGLIGLALMLYFVGHDIFHTMNRNRIKLKDEALLATLTLFILLSSLLESGLGDRDYPTWVVLLIIASSLKRLDKEKIVLPTPVKKIGFF